MCVVMTARNEFDLNINAEFWAMLTEEGIDTGRFRHLRIEPMSEEDVGHLACKRLGKSASELDGRISKTVHSQSRGNPLLACQFLDVMYKETSEVAVSGAALNKIEELLLNRLDELAPIDRSHLNLGAILGFSFQEKDVVAVMEKYNDVAAEDRARHAQTVHSSLQGSVEFGILKCNGEGEEITYTFAHVLWSKTISQHILDAWKDKMRALIDIVKGDDAVNLLSSCASVTTASVTQPPSSTTVSIETIESLINSATQLATEELATDSAPQPPSSNSVNHKAIESIIASTSEFATDSATELASDSAPHPPSSNSVKLEGIESTIASTSQFATDSATEPASATSVSIDAIESLLASTTQFENFATPTKTTEPCTASNISTSSPSMSLGSLFANTSTSPHTSPHSQSLPATPSNALLTDGDFSIKYDWDELAQVRAKFSSMREQNVGIQQSINELRALINHTR